MSPALWVRHLQLIGCNGRNIIGCRWPWFYLDYSGGGRRPLLKTRVIMKTTIRRLIESEASGCAADPPESDN